MNSYNNSVNRDINDDTSELLFNLILEEKEIEIEENQLKVKTEPCQQDSIDRKESISSHCSEYEIGKQINYVNDSIEYDSSIQNKKKMQPTDFIKRTVLGKGAYGKVYLVTHKQSGYIYAMKVLKKATLKVLVKGAEHTKNERQILSEVQHPNIVQLNYAFQTKEKLYLILEFVPGGELFFHLAKERMFSNDIAKFYASQIVLALEHLHKLGIVYRDLKPENCLLDSKGYIKLTDFGLSKVGLDDLKDKKTNTVCGTTEYMAPEILNEQSYDYNVDWWSLGILIYDMLTGSPPYKGNNRKKVYDSIMKNKLKCPNYLHSDAKDLLIKLLKKNPNQRLGSKGSEQIKKHAFFKGIDFDALYNQSILAPIVPLIFDPYDTQNFAKQFTDSPLDSPELKPAQINNNNNNSIDNESLNYNLKNKENQYNNEKDINKKERISINYNNINYQEEMDFNASFLGFSYTAPHAFPISMEKGSTLCTINEDNNLNLETNLK